MQRHLAFLIPVFIFILAGAASATDSLPAELVFTSEEKDYIARSAPLVIGFRQSGKPVIYRNDAGDIAGIAPSCLDLIHRKCGLTFSYIQMADDSDIRGALLSGRLDAIVTFTNESGTFGEDITVSPHLLSVPMVLVVDRKTQYEHAHDITYIVKRGFDTAVSFINTTNPDSTILYLDTQNIEGCLDAIMHRKADATFLNTYTASYLLQKPEYSNLLVLPQIYFSQYLCLAMRKNADPHMISIISKTISSITQTEIQNITLADTAGLRYQKTLYDTIYEHRIPLFLIATGFVFIASGIFVLLSMNRKLNAANESKTQLLSRVSHEIRTPVNAICGLSYLGQKNTSDASSLSYFIKIEASGRYLSGLINDILDMNKMDNGKIRLNASRTSFQAIIDSIHTIMDPLAAQKKISFVISGNNDNMLLLCDKMRVEQILINLLTNAIKFTAPGGTVTLAINRKDSPIKTKVEFTVTDTGCGMSRQFMSKLFQPFAQENRNPSVYGTGTGLGLVISKKLARLMGGDITASSEEGKGSTFTVTLFLNKYGTNDIEAAADTKENSSAADDSVLVGKHALLAEDNEINTEIACGILGKKGIIVDAVQDGAQAVQKFSESAEHAYDIILMDIRMPHMDGFEAAKAIRSLARRDAQRIPIIAMTADAFTDSIEKSRACGMNDYITKPVDVEELYKCLMRYTA